MTALLARRQELWRKSLYIAPWVIFIIPFIVYFLIVLIYAVDVPYSDDYDAVLVFVNAFMTSSSGAEKIRLIFMQHNEHRIVFDRLIILFQVYVLGGVNFRNMIILGNIGWMLTVVALALKFKKEYDLSIWQIVPISYTLLAVTHWENMYSAMSSIANYWVLLFCVLFLSYLTKENILLICILFVVSLYTSGGGVLLYFFGLAYLFFEKRYGHLTIFFLISTIFVIFYFTDYHSPPQHPSAIVALESFTAFIMYVLMLLGSLMRDREMALFLGGSIVLIITGMLIFFHNKRLNHFLFLLIVFLFATALTTALSRSGFGVDQALSSRYTMYSLISLVALYGLLMSLPVSREIIQKIVIVFFGLSVALFGGNLLENHLTQLFTRIAVARIASIGAFERGDNSYLMHPSTAHAAEQLIQSEKSGVYDYKKVRLLTPVSYDLATIKGNTTLNWNVDQITNTHVIGWAYVPMKVSRQSTTYILLEGNDHLFKLDTLRVKRADISQAFQLPIFYDYAGFESFISAYALPSGSYKVGIFIDGPDYQGYAWSDKKIDIP